MSFVDEMRKLSADKEKELAQKSDKDIENSLKGIKSRIRATVAGGEKYISEDDHLCFATRNNQPEYVVFDIRMGLANAHIKWSMTQEMLERLERLRKAAAEDGITITGFSYVLGNGGGDDSRSYDSDRFYEDYGALTIPRAYCTPYMTSIKDPQKWQVYVSCSYTFSV